MYQQGILQLVPYSSDMPFGSGTSTRKSPVKKLGRRSFLTNPTAIRALAHLSPPPSAICSAIHYRRHHPPPQRSPPLHAPLKRREKRNPSRSFGQGLPDWSWPTSWTCQAPSAATRSSSPRFPGPSLNKCGPGSSRNSVCPAWPASLNCY